MNIFKSDFKLTQGYGCTGVLSEPPYGACPHFHRGWDMVGLFPKCPVYAAVPGIVFQAGRDSDGAIYCIQHADTGHWVYYWHLDEVLVKAGFRLTPDSQIGTMGMTGNASGYHTHFEVDLPGPWLGGTLKMTPTNPGPFITAGGSEVENRKIVTDLYQEFTGNVPNDSIVQQKTDFLGGGDLRQLVRDLIGAGNNYYDGERIVEALYNAALGHLPAPEIITQKADFLRGGGSLAQLISEVFPHDAADPVTQGKAKKYDQVVAITGGS